MSLEFNMKEDAILLGYLVALEKERIALVGRTMPGFIHETNGSIGSINTLVSFMDDRLESMKSKFSKNELKKSDLEDLIQTLEESIANGSLICQHANDHNETVRTISNLQNRPSESTQNINDLMHAYKMMLKPYLKKNNIKMNEQLSGEFSFHCDYSWVTTALFLWLQIFLDEKALTGAEETDSVVELISTFDEKQFELILETSFAFSPKVIEVLLDKDRTNFETSIQQVSSHCILLWLCLNLKLTPYHITYEVGTNGRFALIFKKTEEII